MSVLIDLPITILFKVPCRTIEAAAFSNAPRVHIHYRDLSMPKSILPPRCRPCLATYPSLSEREITACELRLSNKCTRNGYRRSDCREFVQAKVRGGREKRAIASECRCKKAYPASQFSLKRRFFCCVSSQIQARYANAQTKRSPVNAGV